MFDRGRGRPAKSLEELVRNGTFLGRRHRDLLESSELVPWVTLARIQRRYREAEHESLRKAFALDFQKAIPSVLERRKRAMAQLPEVLEKLGPPGSLERIVGFFPRFLRHVEGPLAGRPFRLGQYEVDFLRDFTKRDRHGVRLYPVGLLGIGKGNGKTPFGAGLCLEQTVSVANANVYDLAGSREQAGYAFGFAETNAENDDGLGKWMKVGSSSIAYPDESGTFTILTSEGKYGAGVNPTFGQVDEWCFFQHTKEREAYNALAKALHKQFGGLFIGTTAGWDKETSQLGETYTKALAGPGIEVHRDGCLTIVRDAESGFLMHWYAVPDDADIEDPRILALANPMLTKLQVRELLRELNRADTIENDWRRLHANQWYAQGRAWPVAAVWDELATDIEIPKGAAITVAVDAAFSYDTTAVSWSWRKDDETVVQDGYVWSTRADTPAHEHVRADSLDNEALVEPFILSDLRSRFEILEVVYDPRLFATEAKHLADAGLEVAPLYQQSAQMGEAVETYIRRALAKKIAWNRRNRVMAAHVKATASVKTERGMKIFKLKHARPIDLATANVMSGWRALFYEPKRKKTSKRIVSW